ncbi:MAG: biosynthetic arginine decarboxylase, partial [Planctomycetes bacterium]|nr:biosynthetic arginine decarboxylase [Planctomycetota bacterium]
MAVGPTKWSTAQSAELYNLPGWGSPYFSIRDDGTVQVHPNGPDGPAASLVDIIAGAKRQGMSLPLLIRFDGILRQRVQSLSRAFRQAAEEYGYSGRHRPVYPIKVNQQRHVVETLLESGRDIGVGLEVGSKPELLAVVAQLDRPSLMICNGYKDEAYMEMACLAVRLGHEVVVVVEKPSEIETFSRVVDREGRNAAPWIGMRSRLATRGSGRWESSSGDRAKFGLSAQQMVEAVQWLRDVQLLDRLRLLHFHIGSQITAIRPWKEVLREASRLFIELHKMGAPLDIFDVGGGLAVDYDGSRTRFDSSMNYTEQEYANDVVWHIHDACTKAGIKSPDIVTESGRALVAHHSVMAVEVIGVSRLSRDGLVEKAGRKESDIVQEMRENLSRLTRKNMLEVYHDAQSLRDEMLSRFNLGLVDLPTRAQGENIFFATCDRLQNLVRQMDYVPEEFEGLEKQIADTYFCNFSVFQSVPDHWAIRHVFPVMPLQRLHEEPSVRAVLGDMTCDSDGKIDRFPHPRDVKDVLEVHPVKPGESYVLGIFLVGAYQEILGDLHNLFGDTDAVHVDVDAQGQFRIVDRLQGEPVGKVLSYVGYNEEWLMSRYDKALARLVEKGDLTQPEAEEVRDDLVRGLKSNTYLTARSVRAVREADFAEKDEGLPAEGVPVPTTAGSGGA